MHARQFWSNQNTALLKLLILLYAWTYDQRRIQAMKNWTLADMKIYTPPAFCWNRKHFATPSWRSSHLECSLYSVTRFYVNRKYMSRIALRYRFKTLMFILEVMKRKYSCCWRYENAIFFSNTFYQDIYGVENNISKAWEEKYFQWAVVNRMCPMVWKNNVL